FWAEHPAAVLWTGVMCLVIVLLLAATKAGGVRRLIDILAVVTILAILASMLLPSLAKAKQKAQRISALNNLKEIGTALRLYSGDNNGTTRLPATLDAVRNELGQSDKLLVDPDSGQRFIYVGAGKRLDDPRAIIAFSPEGPNGRSVLFGDGSVQLMSSAQFVEAEAREASAAVYQSTVGGAFGTHGGGAGGFGGGGGLAGAATPAVPQNAPAPALAAAPARIGAAEAPVQSAGLLAGAAVPTAAGLRSIHIDIPQHGQPFVFTKVLNTGAAPLDIKMSVMNARVFVAMRSGIQVAAFLLGLLLIWRQWRQRNSLMITLGAALALGAVAEMLLAGRILHVAFIIGVPLLALAVFLVILRKMWLQKAAAPARESSIPPPPVVPPVAASVALLLLLTCSATAQDSAAAMPPAPRGPQSAITAASYTGVIGERVAQFEGSLQVASFSTNQTVALFGDEVALQDFSVKSGEARLLRENGRLSVLLPHAGEAAVTLKFVVKLGGDVTRRQLSFALPPALASTVNASIDEPDAEVEFPSAVAFQRTPAGRQTRIAATVGSEDRVEIVWTPRTKRANEVAATIFVENHSLAAFSSGVLEVNCTLDYQISQGELRQARVQLPAGHRLLRVEGEFIRTWQLQEADAAAGGGEVLTVDLLKGVSPNYKLSIETEKILDAFPVTAAVAVPHALEVKRETGLVAAR
ncbi:MAG TPA: hypothetical protein VN765_13850, partial [Candidatus Acidoferrum sp.]|nr:hypothetical protein [Candidatus Acidoferrum sp.]